MSDLAVHFTRTFAAAHRVWNDPGKCQNIHGHNYDVDVEIHLGDGGLTEQNFITPFDAIKNVIDFYDHVLIVDSDDPSVEQFLALPVIVRTVDGVPSTEFMVDRIAREITAAVAEANPAAESFDVQVALRETAGIQASTSETYEPW